VLDIGLGFVRNVCRDWPAGARSLYYTSRAIVRRPACRPRSGCPFVARGEPRFRLGATPSKRQENKSGEAETRNFTGVFRARNKPVIASPA
jgi:hypothetical protein